MDLDFAVLADGVSPRPDGKLDIFGAGFDTIFARRVPVTHPRLAVVTRIFLGEADVAEPHRVEVAIDACGGERIAAATTRVEPPPDKASEVLAAGRAFGLAMVLNFDNVVFPDYGEYELSIRWDDVDIRSALRLMVAEPATAT
jgi:hypothetical protein